MNIRNNIETTRVVNSKINLSILKPKLLKALNEGSYFSDLPKFLVEKSKYRPYGDVITYHLETLFDYTFK